MYLLHDSTVDYYHCRPSYDGYYAKPIESCWNLKIFNTIDDAEKAKGFLMKNFNIVSFTDELRQAYLHAKIVLKPMHAEFPVRVDEFY